MKKLKSPVLVTIVAIATIGGLCAYALHLGHNTTLISLSFTIIAGLAGYRIGKK